MAKFGRLKKLDVAGRTIPFVLEEAHVPEFCDEPPVLQLAHMGRANKGYFNARMAIGAKGIAKAVKGKNTKSGAKKAAVEFATAEASNLARERELMPIHIVTDWEHLYDDKGIVVPYTREDAVELLAELPDDVIEDMRDKAADISEFRDLIAADPADVEEALGNSDSD